MSDNAMRRPLDLHHNSHVRIIDDALAKMSAGLSVGLPRARLTEMAVYGSIACSSSFPREARGAGRIAGSADGRGAQCQCISSLAVGGLTAADAPAAGVPIPARSRL